MASHTMKTEQIDVYIYIYIYLYVYSRLAAVSHHMFTCEFWPGKPNNDNNTIFGFGGRTVHEYMSGN